MYSGKIAENLSYKSALRVTFEFVLEIEISSKKRLPKYFRSPETARFTTPKAINKEVKQLQDATFL